MIMAVALFAINNVQASTIERKSPENKIYCNNDEKVEGSSKERYSIHWDANEKVCVTVTGDGDTDLDLYIFDEYDNLVAADEDYTDKCICNLTVERSGEYTIVVVNCGTFVNYYSLNIF
jgi:hypothetical protein